jgi:hypothetical protein
LRTLKSGDNTSLKLCQVEKIFGIASMLGIGSSQAEITDDEASDVSEASPAPATIKRKKKGKEKVKPKVVEEVEESLMVESEKEEDEDDDDEPVGPDECVDLTLRAIVC